MASDRRCIWGWTQRHQPQHFFIMLGLKQICVRSFGSAYVNQSAAARFIRVEGTPMNSPLFMFQSPGLNHKRLYKTKSQLHRLKRMKFTKPSHKSLFKNLGLV